MSIYDEIIHFSYSGPQFHTPMPMKKRAAQFSAFTPLEGQTDKINEANNASSQIPAHPRRQGI